MRFRRNDWEKQAPIDLLVSELGVDLAAVILLTDVPTLRRWKRCEVELEQDQKTRIEWFRDACLWFRKYCSTTASIKTWVTDYELDFMKANAELDGMFKRISFCSLRKY